MDRYDLTKLKVYQEARKLKIDTFELSKQLPRSEKYSLVKDLERTARSITANIAEGYGRYNYQDSTKFFRNARGSLLGLQDHIDSAFIMGYLTNQELKRFAEMISVSAKLTNGYIRFLQKRKNSDVTNS